MARLCTKKKEDGTECGASMTERTAFHECPECGHIEMLLPEELRQKIEREKRRNKPGHFVMPRHPFATEEGDEIRAD